MLSIIKRVKLTEVLITSALAAILMVMAVPIVGSIRDSRHTDQIIETAETLSEAATLFKRDVGRTATEFSPSSDGQSYVHPRFHELSMTQSMNGWRGPYLRQPLTRKQNPFGRGVYLQNSLGASPAHGFALRGAAGGLERSGGQFVVFHGVPERIAREIDTILDKGMTGKRNWDETGRVEWAPGGGGSLSICLLAKEKK